MFKKILIFILLIFSSCGKNTSIFQLETAFESSHGHKTSTYEEVIDMYIKAEKRSNLLTLYEFGKTDHGEPLHLLQLKPEQAVTHPLKILILNGIHPGEPDGIDASMLLIKKIIHQDFVLPENIELYIVPIYNIGGALNRNNSSRANQNGPDAYGFRGNAKNYDLNRDFIKSDTQNSKAFYQIYHKVNPDVFIDTHVSNGADYQYTLTHLFTQPQQIGGEFGDYIQHQFIPKIEEDLRGKKLPITPYVNVFNRTPENGFTQFLDTPRYSTGYTRLWGSLGLMIETHMLKPYPERVDATLQMLESLIDVSAIEANNIQKKRTKHSEKIQNAAYYDFNYAVDSTLFKTFQFLGYQATMEDSKVTGKKRLKYHPDQPLTYPVKYYNNFSPTATIKIPNAYLIPKAYQEILELFQLNKVQMTTFQKDTTINTEVYYISDYKTRKNPYEGHYLHYQTKVTSKIENVKIKPGDVLVKTQQPSIRYLLETLEPEAVDSFFNWNFFDAILQQKEGFSPYVFEEEAAKILQDNPELKTQFEALKNKNEDFSGNAYAQLDWIYKHSSFYEKAHNRYPILRILK